MVLLKMNKKLNHWSSSGFQQKKTKKKLVTYDKSDSDIYIDSDSLIHIICKQGRHEYVE